MPRKGENIYKRKDGRWEARYIKSHDISEEQNMGMFTENLIGKQSKNNIMRWRSWRIPLILEIIKSFLYKSDVKALSVYWLTSIEPQIKQSTFNKYNNLLASYIVPYLGDIEINDLAVDKLYEWCNYLLQKGGKKKMGFLPKLCLMRCRLSEELFVMLPVGDTRHYAQVELSINQPSKEINVLTRSEQDALCRYLYKHPCERNIGILLSLFTGLRIGSFVPWIGLIYRLKVEPYIHKTFSAYKRK